MSLSKKENIFILISGILFLALIGICSYFNRFAVDDYYHIHDVKLYGIWGGMLEGYNNWGGRWTSYLLWDCIYRFHDNLIILALYTFSIIIFFIHSVYFFLKRIFDLSGIHLNQKNIFAFSILFSIFTFFFSFGKGEIWFWTVSSTMYILSIISFIYGLGFILSKNKNILTVIAIITTFTFSGGAAETYAAIFILILIVIFASFYFLKNNKIVSDTKERAYFKIIIALIFLIASFIISVTAPGNAVRASWLPESSFIKSFYITFKELGKIIIYKFIPQLPWMLLFIAPFSLFGYFSGENVEKKSFRQIFKPFLFSLIFLLILMYILLFPSCYILSEAGPDRSLSLMILFAAIFIAAWAFYIGKYFIKKIQIVQSVSFISIIAVIISIATICIIQLDTLAKYSSALDKRTEKLQQLQKEKNKKTVLVEPLPSSGYLYSAEFSSDTTFFGNEHYRLGLFLDFKVLSKK